MKFTILGCGSSMGVPRADGFFGKCNPKNKKNYRTRCSALLQSNNANILIDTSPDLRMQLLSNKIINKILIFRGKYNFSSFLKINFNFYESLYLYPTPYKVSI